MRFSLKWLLAAMAYVALAAVALTRAEWYYADALKAAAFFATAAAFVGAIFNRGARQHAAAGFAAASALLTICLVLFPGCLPVTPLARTMSNQPPPPYAPSSVYTAPVRPPATTGAPAVTMMPTVTAPVAYPNAVPPYSAGPESQERNRALTAIYVMAAGLIGSALGVIVSRQAAGSSASPGSAGRG